MKKTIIASTVQAVTFLIVSDATCETLTIILHTFTAHPTPHTTLTPLRAPCIRGGVASGTLVGR